jgi:hypothetical protein
MTWYPATKTNALEMFETPCLTDVWIHGSYGEQCKAYEGEGTIALEFDPEERGRVIEMLSALLASMKNPK